MVGSAVWNSFWPYNGPLCDGFEIMSRMGIGLIAVAQTQGQVT